MENKGEILKSRPSVSILILTLNEAGNIEQTVKLVTASIMEQNLYDYEIIVVDGGSTDGTQQIIEKLASDDNHLHPIYGYGKKGLGHDFKNGLAHASKEYVGWFPGDNETLPETITAILEKIGRADIIIPYTVNYYVRSMYRRCLSAAYTALFNLIFGLKLKYFNGPCFFRRDLLKTVEMTTDSPAYMAEILVQLVGRNDVSYAEVPMYIKKRDYGASHVLKWKNVYLIGKTLLSLINRIYFR